MSTSSASLYLRPFPRVSRLVLLRGRPTPSPSDRLRGPLPLPTLSTYPRKLTQRFVLSSLDFTVAAAFPGAKCVCFWSISSPDQGFSCSAKRWFFNLYNSTNFQQFKACCIVGFGLADLELQIFFFFFSSRVLSLKLGFWVVDQWICDWEEFWMIYWHIVEIFMLCFVIESYLCLVLCREHVKGSFFSLIIQICWYSVRY